VTLRLYKIARLSSSVQHFSSCTMQDILRFVRVARYTLRANAVLFSGSILLFKERLEAFAYGPHVGLINVHVVSASYAVQSGELPLGNQSDDNSTSSKTAAPA